MKSLNVFLFEYKRDSFMNLNKIKVFKENYEKIINKKIKVKFVFYGDASNEEFATFMAYFNKLLCNNITEFSISFRTKMLIYENGINNKAIKLSASHAKDIQNKKFNGIIEEYYKDEENIKVKIMPVIEWENTILDLIF